DAAENERYMQAYLAAKTHAQTLEDIETLYQANIKALGDTATQEQLDQLKLIKDETIRAANEAEAEKSAALTKGAGTQLAITVAALKSQKQAITMLLSKDLSAELRKQLESDL